MNLNIYCFKILSIIFNILLWNITTLKHTYYLNKTNKLEIRSVESSLYILSCLLCVRPQLKIHILAHDA